MHRSFFAVKDTFINSGSKESDGTTFQDKNVGQDEVLELKKIFRNKEFHAPTRMLIQFNTVEIKNYITSSNVPSNYKLILKLYEANGTSGLSETYDVAAYPLSQEWDEGVGKEVDDPKTVEGCSWLNRKNSNGIETTWTTAGGTYIASDEVTQSFSLSSPDIVMDVTTVGKKWFSGDNENHGFLLRLSGSKETSSGSFEDLKFFSRQTNTIYSPKLELRWDDHLPATGSNTGSLTPLDLSGQTENYLYQLHKREAYKETETIKFRFGARKRYIDKSFSTSIQTVSGSYFPEGSASYSIIDMATNEDVIPFSPYTTMSCDPVSPFFTQDLNTFEPNRAYKIVIKVKHNDNQTIVYDDDFEFILRS
tara:strand:+ start:3124 stop:4215 length:1092 start_codon:yes stop_codon:yes gene_type:complete